MWDWGDGTFCNWIGPYHSGDECSISHIWNKQGSYNVKVKAKDVTGIHGPWSDPLVISMPKTKSIDEITHLIFKLIQRFPILEFLF